MVVVRVWDLDGQTPLGLQKVELSVLRKAEELARSRDARVVEGLVRLALRDLDLAQLDEEIDSQWVKNAEFESALPKGYYLDSEQGLTKDLTQVTEMELG